jgi:hypothetical protein
MEVLFDELGVWDAWMVDIVNERRKTQTNWVKGSDMILP